MTPQPEHSEADKVTIENLLRLKRAERPSPEFWTRFEQDLRAKQLAAIIEKRPWWLTLRLPQAGRALSRLQIPVGAAAVLALSVVAVRQYRPSTLVDTVPAPVIVAGRTVPPLHAQPASVAPAVMVAEVPVSKPGVNTLSVRAQIVPAPPDSGELMAMIPWAAPRSGVASDETHSDQMIGELPQVHFASAINPGSDHDFESRVDLAPIGVSVASAPVDEPPAASRVSPVSPREVRRNRILSTLVVADNSSESDHSRLAQMREVIASSLDDDRLYDSVRRLGMGGDRLTLKF